jgi:hypothetical protein
MYLANLIKNLMHLDQIRTSNTPEQCVGHADATVRPVMVETEYELDLVVCTPIHLEPNDFSKDNVDDRILKGSTTVKESKQKVLLTLIARFLDIIVHMQGS